MTLFLVEQLEDIDETTIFLGIYTSFEIAIEKIEKNYGKLDWTFYPEGDISIATIDKYTEICISEVRLDEDIDK